jgi:CTP-dependent riboflavin kinase
MAYRMSDGNRVADSMRFVGRVKDGIGQYSIMMLPGEASIQGLIRDWPEQPQPGSLNVRVDPNGFPARFLKEFGDPSIWNLDTRRFRPEAELSYDVIPNNTLVPRPGQPDRGRPQIWRAYLTKIESGESIQCWVLRRMHSKVRKDTLECVAGSRLRDALRLENDDQVELIVEGSWQ